MRRISRLILAGVLCVCMMGAAGADEWINLFDGETLFGWTQFGASQWQAVDGNLVFTDGAGGWLATTSQFADFELTAKVKVAGEGAMALLFRAGCEGSPTENGSSFIVIEEPKKGKGDWHDVAVTANGDAVSVKVDGKDAQVQGGGRKVGYIGVAAYERGKKVEVSGLKLRPLNTKPIFNGTDLTGWNIIPDHKSEFKVVDGALNITNGNGQIETAGLYKNFVLQIDIFSNGKKLNSGVFFRGPVGVFWKGYESQVRNDWAGDDRTKPVDFGTGGNYGNQPARKVVSSDGEWFTKTLVCDGNHAAVWINGYLVSDYVDMRPVSPESQGKEGYVPGPGTIHLQGHDPTTNLSFKNIVLQEYPEN